MKYNLFSSKGIRLKLEPIKSKSMYVKLTPCTFIVGDLTVSSPFGHSVGKLATAKFSVTVDFKSKANERYGILFFLHESLCIQGNGTSVFWLNFNLKHVAIPSKSHKGYKSQGRIGIGKNNFQ